MEGTSADISLVTSIGSVVVTLIVGAVAIGITIHFKRQADEVNARTHARLTDINNRTIEMSDHQIPSLYETIIRYGLSPDRLLPEIHDDRVRRLVEGDGENAPRAGGWDGPDDGFRAVESKTGPGEVEPAVARSATVWVEDLDRRLHVVRVGYWASFLNTLRLFYGFQADEYGETWILEDPRTQAPLDRDVVLGQPDPVTVIVKDHFAVAPLWAPLLRLKRLKQ